jgi:hypothetical protein
VVGEVGSIALLVRATMYFSEHLRPMGIDEVLRVDPTVRNVEPLSTTPHGS